MTPAQMLDVARQVLTGDDLHVGGNRSVVAAVLARRALEGALDEFWGTHLSGITACSSRVQLISLPFYLGNRDLAAEACYAWSALSASCHHAVNALPVSPNEMAHLVDIVQAVIDSAS